MNWYQVLKSIQKHQEPLIDLSTGNPLLIDELSEVLSRSLRAISDRDDMATELGGYMNVDGLPDLIDGFADSCVPHIGYRLDREQVLVVPGIQAALRYAHEILRQRQESKRILFPVGLEFPGAVDPYSTLPPAIGPYQTASVDTDYFQPYMEPLSLDWESVGAVIISRPHNPTGCVWTAEAMTRLADEAAEHGAWLIQDETYALPFAPLMEKEYSFIDRPNNIHLYSFSKVGLAGERIGLVVAAPEIIQSFREMLRRNLIQAPKSGQRLALAVIQAIQSNPGLGRSFGALYRERWDLCRRLLFNVALPARIALWQGGPFLWCQWPGTLSSDDVFDSLLHRGVAVAPSSALWVSPRAAGQKSEAIRIGLGADLADLEKAIPVVANVLRMLLRLADDGNTPQKGLHSPGKMRPLADLS